MSFSAFDLTGKVALITGGNSGIGLGMAKGLVQAGADVCIWGTNLDKNTHAEEMLQALGGNVKALQCDVSNEQAVENAFEKTLELFGKVDSCFANAGAGGKMYFKVREAVCVPTNEIISIKSNWVRKAEGTTGS